MTPIINQHHHAQMSATQFKAAKAHAEKVGHYKGKSLALGKGGRFALRVDELRSQGYSPEQARAIAAKSGQQKYGAQQMSTWSQESAHHAGQASAVASTAPGHSAHQMATSTKLSPSP